jgi:predicted LPLAT superfamily acyltransferase
VAAGQGVVSETSDWASKSERGNRGWLRFAIWSYRNLGRIGLALILVPITAYFLIFDRVCRRSSREWLATAWATPQGRAALGRRPGLFRSYRHVYGFAISVMDRMILWAGGADLFQFEHTGGERLLELARQGRGAILLGAHLGSFDMLRLISSQYGLRVNVLMYTKHAARVNELFDSLSGESKLRVISVDPGSVQSAFEIKACLERGEFVGILADRVHPGGRERPMATQFAGRRAAFPLSPFLLGAVLGAPVFLSLCLSRGACRYFAVTEPLYEGGKVPREQREKLAQELLHAWVARFEHYCLAEPMQWFNFYDFFGDGLRALESAP